MLNKPLQFDYYNGKFIYWFVGYKITQQDTVKFKIEKYDTIL
jgi:hypothetical protein